MSSAEETTKSNPQRSVVEDFTVEASDDRNRTISLATIRQRLRGAWSLARFYGPNGGRDIGSAMNKMPDIPGQRLEIMPKAGKVRIYDPLEKDRAKLDQINRACDDAQSVRLGAQRFAPVPEAVIELDPDGIKTLIVEVVKLIKEGDMQLVVGTVPTEKEIAAMSGRELYDPWSNSNDKPKYKDDVPAWEDRMLMRGR